MTLVYVALGSNLFQPIQQLCSAIEAIQRLPAVRLLAVAPVYRSKPWQMSGSQGDVYNTVLALHCQHSAVVLLQWLQGIERSHRRQRGSRSMGRALDLDILWGQGWSFHTAHLQVPHPRMMQRLFVLYPLLSVAYLAPRALRDRWQSAAAALQHSGQQLFEDSAASGLCQRVVRRAVAHAVS